VDIGVVGDEAGDGGVPHGAALNAFVDATLSFDAEAIAGAAAELEQAIGRTGLVDAAAVAAMFQLNTRAADAAGIPVEAPTVSGRSTIGARLGFAPRESGIAP
jgi:hypothetical protein